MICFSFFVWLIVLTDDLLKACSKKYKKSICSSNFCKNNYVEIIMLNLLLYFKENKSIIMLNYHCLKMFKYLIWLIDFLRCSFNF